MKPKRHYIQWAAVFFLMAALGTGCVPRDTLEKMQDQLNYLEAAARRNSRDTERMDSILTENVNTNRELRADVYTALDELQHELGAIRESIADLNVKVDRRGTEYPVVYYPQVTGADTSGAAVPGTTNTAGGELLTVDCGKLYEQGFNDLRNGNYDMAIEGFEEFLRTCATSPDVPRALYWLGESHYSNDDYAKGIEVFGQLVDEYPDSDRLPEALFKLGRCYEKSDQPRHAISYYERLIKEYPAAPIVRPAEARLNVLQSDNGD